MAYILRQYKCSACGTTWESLKPPTCCPAWMADEGHVRVYDIVPVIGVPASYKHSSWSDWQRK
jgi:hypothetical protein